MDPFLFESIVSNWLLTNARDLLVRREREGWPDFELRDLKGRRLLLEIKARAPGRSGLQHMAKRLTSASDPSARFLLVTPAPPNESDLLRFSGAFRDFPAEAKWLPIQDLPAYLGRPSPGQWDSPRTWSELQTSALVKGLEAYRGAPIGIGPLDAQPPSSDLQSLARQFPHELLSSLDATQPLELSFGLGARRDNVTVVLSDIANFSSLVTASRPDDLREAMGQYYRKAREAVFGHHGMLDKFIGDAVLAVFGYPIATPMASVQALRLANDLIVIGNEVMEGWQAELNAVISTGTRVGIATGDLWPINIGESAIEVSLLGDTINLAARLEKNCAVDRFLMDNRTHTACMRADASFVESLGLQQIIIPAADAKGQAFATRAWTQQ